MQNGRFRLSECTWTEIRDRLTFARVALAPAGANEAAGPHLPTAADTITAEEMCVRGAAELRRRGIEAFVLPALPYGSSYVSYPYPGTIILTAATIQAVMTDVGRSVERYGVTHLLYVSAHLEPAQLSALQGAADVLGRETRLKAAVLDLREPRWAERLSDEFRSGARHAGSYATSLVLAMRPDLVHMDMAKTLPPIRINMLEAFKQGAQSYNQIGSPLAYFGDPAKASAEEGERLYAALGTIVADAVEELRHLGRQGVL